MVSLLDAMLVVVLVLNVYALGTGRIRAIIRTVALQGVLLGLMPLLVHGEIHAESVLVALATVSLKGVAIPIMLFRAMRTAHIKREVEPLIGLSTSMVLGAVSAGLALAFTRHLPLMPQHASQLLVPTSLATVLAGFLLITTRVKAISQVLGYLMLENGIFVFGLLLIEAMPFLVEMGVLLDLLVAIFVMGIMIDHISREFSSLDTSELSRLKE